MPTGYTSFIEDGKITTAKQFLHLCLRNFGVTMLLRDTSMEVKDDYTQDLVNAYQEEIDYHQKKLTEAEEKLKEIKSLSEDELFSRYIQDAQEDIESYTKYKEKCDADNSNYQRIAEDIRNWQCDSKFENIKQFALDQIRISKSDPDYWEQKLQECHQPTREAFQEKKEEYLNGLIKDVQWDIDFHTEQLQKVRNRMEENLSFYKQFVQELENLK